MMSDLSDLSGRDGLVAANLRRLMRARGYNPDDPGDVRLLGAACRPEASRDSQREEIRTVINGHWPKPAKWDRICRVGLRVNPMELLRPLGQDS